MIRQLDYVTIKNGRFLILDLMFLERRKPKERVLHRTS